MNIKVTDLSKAYGGPPVLEALNLELSSGQVYCLMGPSGSGKTTFLRILLGLERPDSGRVEFLGGGRLAAVFQEDRLCESFSPAENVGMAADPSFTASDIRRELRLLLPDESLNRPVSTLSGGMKRRTAICRSVLAPSQGILMDEPFTGLDEATKRKVIGYILQRTAGKLLVISTHQEEDLELLGGIKLTLK